MSTQSSFLIGVETCVLTLLRSGLFFASRKYLLSSLSHGLQDLSEGEPLLSSTDEDVEMDTLPTPTTATTPNNASFQVFRHTFHSTLSRTLFSLCFSESCMLFALLIFQGVDVFHARTRLFNWKISLWLLLAIIVIFIPLAYSLVLSYRSSTSRQTIHRPSLLRIVLTAFLVGLFLFLLSFVPLPSGLVPSSSLWQIVLSRLIVVGTLILGLLSGFGAVNNAWRFFPRVTRGARNDPTDDDVQVAEDGLQRVRNDLATRRRSIEQIEAAQPNTDDMSWFARVVPNLRGDSQLTSAMQELTGLEALEYQMARNLQALRQQRAEAKFSKTMRGRLINWAGRLFAVYCVYRIVMAVVNIVFSSRTTTAPSPVPQEPPNASIDFLTFLLAHMLSLVPSIHLEPDEVAVISRQISLALVGVIILSSIRLVLRGVARALRVTNRKLGASLMLLMLAQVMGIYLLSTLVQLRTSFPPPPSRPDTQPDIGLVNLFSTLPEFQVFGSVFDTAFLLAAAISAIVLWFYHRINSVGVIDTS